MRASWTMALLTTLLVAACGDDSGTGDADAGSDGGPGGFCGTLADYATRCGGGACTDALITDCDAFLGIVSPDLTASLGACLEASGPLTDCLFDALGSVSPRDAQRAFATAFCEGCVSVGASACESAFFDEESGDTGIAGLLVLGLGDAVVERMTEECTSGLTCALEIQSCAQRVIVESGLPEETARCLVDSIVGGDGFTSTCPSSDGGAHDGGSTRMDGGGSGDGGSTDGGSRDGGVGPTDGGMPGTCSPGDRSAYEPNETRAAAPVLGAIPRTARPIPPTRSAPAQTVRRTSIGTRTPSATTSAASQSRAQTFAVTVRYGSAHTGPARQERPTRSTATWARPAPPMVSAGAV